MLSAKLEKYLVTINSYLLEYKKAPTNKELGDLMGVTNQSAYEAIERLVEKGFLNKITSDRRSSHRNIELTQQSVSFLKAKNFEIHQSIEDRKKVEEHLLNIVKAMAWLDTLSDCEEKTFVKSLLINKASEEMKHEL